MKKIKSIIIIMLLITIASIILPTTSLAANTITVYGKPRYNNLLKRNGVDLTCIPLVYQKDGVEHPVYCLNLELDGATETFSYELNVDNQLTNMEIWRTIINGYPYKTPAELGCQTKEEAYLATRQAVYCAVYGRDPNSYSALGGEAGERTLNAMKKIVNTARTSKETKASSNLTIKSNNSLWTIDELDSNYVSKTFTVTAAAGIQSYTINVSGNTVEGMKITNTNNEEKKEFKSNEQFKIIIPIKNLEKDGTFEIKANGKVATKPILFGLSGNSKLQNVAATGSIYEDGTGNKSEYYFENKTQIVILKQNQNTKEPLKGVKFQLLNSEKEIIYSDLTTNENGIITIDNLLPGKYYVQETETLENYQVYSKLIEIELKLNEEIKITVNNLENKEKPQQEQTKTDLEIEQIKTETEIKQEQTNYSKEKEVINNVNVIERVNNITEKEQVTNNVTKLPKTGM